MFNREGRDYAYAIAYLGSGSDSWQDAYAHAMEVSALAWSYFSTAQLPSTAANLDEHNLTSYATAGASSVLVSETLPGLGEIHYDPANMLDHNPATAWIEGAAGAGIGEQVTLTFAQPVRLSSIGVDVGYDRDAAIFQANNRVRRAHLVFDNGSSVPITFNDQRGSQRISFTPIKTTRVQLVIDDVFADSAYNDTAIAAFEVWGTR